MPANRNLITDVPGLSVGNAHDDAVFTGVTVVLPDAPAIAAIDVRGGGPGTRESDALGPAGTVDHVHAIVFSGGSAFGLAAATGVQSWLADRGVGFDVGGVKIPIVPQAILFDMLNGGTKNWGEAPPYENLARAACNGAGQSFALGSVGAGFGATTATLRGGLGSTSALFEDRYVVGALVAVNAVGSVTLDGDVEGRFWAGPWELDGEFGGLGPPPAWPDPRAAPQLKGGSGQNTTLGIIATDAPLTKRQLHRLAVIAQTGLARAISPVHTPLDGDVVFALSTGDGQSSQDTDWPPGRLALLGDLASKAMARAVARAVFEAQPTPQGWTGPPAWQSIFSPARRD